MMGENKEYLKGQNFLQHVFTSLEIPQLQKYTSLEMWFYYRIIVLLEEFQTHGLQNMEGQLEFLMYTVKLTPLNQLSFFFSRKHVHQILRTIWRSFCNMTIDHLIWYNYWGFCRSLSAATDKLVAAPYFRQF